MTVHFNKNSMATILSFKGVVYTPYARITMDKNQERAMTVTIQKVQSFSNSRSANLGSIFTTQKRKITSQNKKITLITIPSLIILVLRPSRKIQTS